MAADEVDQSVVKHHEWLVAVRAADSYTLAIILEQERGAAEEHESWGKYFRRRADVIAELNRRDGL